jgi:hypothetical protein
VEGADYENWRKQTMKRINLIKYGFVRWPEEDFSDDGNRFTCFRAGKSVRVSKLISNGEVYLSADSSCGKGNLPYDIYSKLPHYNDSSWKWNGVSLDSLTEEDLKEFYEACIAYEREYEEAEATIKYPSLEEIQKKAAELYVAKMAELKEVETLFRDNLSEAVIKFNSYEWKACQESLKNLYANLNRLNPETYPQTILNHPRSFEFIKREHKESFDATYIKELFSKYDIK